jgi:hypothetical protein
VLQSWEGELADEYPMHYRVTRDDPCLRQLLLELQPPV